MKPLSVGVLVSGSGSNLQAILDAAQEGFPARVSLVISNVAGVKALARASRAGVRSEVMPHQGYSSREAFDQAMANTLKEAGVELVVTAGFMRLLTPYFLQQFSQRVINLHPSLLPAFPGTRAIEQALAYGARVTGCTVHFVDIGTDTGPIILQGVAPVEQQDTTETLHQRVQLLEHKLLPEAIRLFALGKLTIQGRRVMIEEE
jgi:phosphoribosylglycinamide formyltransferase 1